MYREALLNYHNTVYNANEPVFTLQVGIYRWYYYFRPPKRMKELGLHILMELSACSKDKLNDLSLLETTLNDAALLADATIIKSVFHQFSPQGVTGVVVVAESHLAIHTWPEFGYAAIDFFTCNHAMNYEKAYHHLVQELSAGKHSYRTIKRGIADHKTSLHEVPAT